MIHLVYISSATSWPSEDELKHLLEKSRLRNQELNITGLLLYGNATYMQVLEGPEKNVHAVFESIKKDPRNNGVVKLLEEKITERSFPDWKMGFKTLAKITSNELEGFADIFINGELDKQSAIDNEKLSYNLLKAFAKNNV